MEIVPTPKQQLYLSSDSDVTLFGGAASGGKSYALVLDALGLNEEPLPRIALKEYKALIYRKYFKDLMDLIDKSKRLYPLIDKGAVFNNSNLIWKFTSGATIQFHFFETQKDATKVQGAEFSFVGVDELGLYENDEVFKFVQSRLRNTIGLKCYFRCTSNPSKYRWIREYFQINSTGDSNKITKEIILSDGTKRKFTTEFIKATLRDNPHIPIEYEMVLQNLSEEDKNAFLDGNWYAYDQQDGIYKNELNLMLKEGRFCNVPYQKNIDVNCACDIGRNDTTSMILYQFIENDIHIFDHYENNNYSIEHYIDWLKEHGYEDANIFLPHDSVAKKIDYEFSVYETICKNFSNVEVIKKCSIEDGIDLVKRKFKNLYIDKNLIRLNECISSYKRKYNPYLGVFEKPLHDWSSNTADALRYLCLSEPISKFDVNKLKSKLNNGYSL